MILKGLSEVRPEKRCLNERTALVGWLVGNWHRLCWVRDCDWLDFTSIAWFGSKEANLTFGSLLLGEEQIPLLQT